MVPKLHKKGRSFRASAGYLLHDPGAKSADRVAWTATRNLATRDPDAAWRVMAATAMDQDRLKAQAGVPNTGRKSNQHVLHFTLSWHPDEAATLDRQEMVRAAWTMLHVMKAQEHQCLVVAHTDRPQPHVHVLVNRVHPRDGRMLSSSFEKLRASRWAEQYEKERGKIYCHERVVNNAARDRGEYTRGEKDKPREVQQAIAAANDNSRREAILQKHRQQSRLLKEIERRQAARHGEAWARHEAGAKETRQRIRLAARRLGAQKLTQLRDAYRPRWTQRHHEAEAQQRLFEQREQNLLGRVTNALKTVDLATLLRRREDSRVSAFGRAFQLLADAGARREALDKQLAAGRRELLGQQQRDETRLRQKVKLARDLALAKERERLDLERNEIVLRQSMERAKLRAQWLEKTQRLREQLRLLGPTAPAKTPPEKAPGPDPAKAVTPSPAKTPDKAPTNCPDPKKEAEREPPTPTRPGDLLPRTGGPEAARQADGWRRMREERRDRGPQRDDGVDR